METKCVHCALFLIFLLGVFVQISTCVPVAQNRVDSISDTVHNVAHTITSGISQAYPQSTRVNGIVSNTFAGVIDIIKNINHQIAV